MMLDAAMGRLRTMMIMSSAKVNDMIARHAPSRCPFILLAEFPRSGVNWVRDLLSDCLQLPVPRRSMFPVTFPALVQTHTGDPISGVPLAYVLRDGRDVFVSHFWQSVASVQSGSPGERQRVLRFHPSLAVPSDDTAGRMVRFYDEWRHRPVGSRLNWGAHVAAWLGRDGAAQPNVIRFEALRDDPRAALARAIAGLGLPVPEDFVIDFAIRRNDLARQKARAAGGVDNLRRLRRHGSVGGWRAEMPESLQRRFSGDFADALALAGYPED